MTNEDFSLKKIQTAILEKKADWIAGENSFTAMAESEQSLLLGYTPGPGEPSLKERENIAKANLEILKASPPTAIGYPTSYDLRNVGGKNFSHLLKIRVVAVLVLLSV